MIEVNRSRIFTGCEVQVVNAEPQKITNLPNIQKSQVLNAFQQVP